MLTEEKIKEFASQFSDLNQINLIPKMRHVMEYEKRLGYDMSKFTKDDFANLFTEYGWVNADRSFRNVKVILGKYMKANGITPQYDISELKIDDVDSGVLYKKNYFASVSDFVDFLNRVFKEEYQVRMKAVAAMYWIGLSPKEISELKIDDVSIQYKSVLGRTDIDEQFIDFLEECYQMKSYEVPNGTGTKRVYVINGDYILRKTEERTGPDSDSQMSVRTICGLSTRMKDIAERAGEQKAFNQKCLHTNGEYVKVHDYELAHPEKFADNTPYKEGSIILEKLLGKSFSRQTYSKFCISYINWKNYFFQD